MSSSVPMARIILISGTGSKNEEIEDLLETSAERVTVVPVGVDMFQSELRRAGADLVILNAETLGDVELEVLKELRAEETTTPVIVASQQLEPGQTRKLFSFNIQDWLCKPVNGEELLESVRKAITFKRATQNHVHAVVSTVGGVGASTIAVSMADIAASKLKRKSGSVALFDLDFSTGNCGYLLNMASEYNLGTVASTPRRIDSEFLHVIQQQHKTGFYVYSFKRPELNTDLNGYELVLRLLDAVSIEHEHTILDIPYYETEWKSDVLSAVNGCTLVTELNLPAIRHALDMIDRLTDLRGPDFEVTVVFNKWRSSLFGQRIGRKRLNELFGDRPRVTLAEDDALMGEAMDRGVPPSAIKRNARFLKQLEKYMKKLNL